jgi:PAS domain S-box-containing protein
MNQDFGLPGKMNEPSADSDASVLVVDDDLLVRRALENILKNEGYQCRTAADGVEGLELLRSEDCDVALIDMHMPRLGGLGLLADMRQAQIQAVPLVLTGFGEISTAVEAMKLGAFDYLTKPPNYQELLRATARAVAHSRARRHGRVMEELATQWEITFDACPDLMAILDLQGRLLRCNQAFAGRLEADKNQLIGLPFQEFLGKDLNCRALLDRALKDAVIQTRELHSDRPAGTFTVTVAPLRSSAGQVFGAVYVARDITERKQAEEARAELLAREQAARVELARLLAETQKREQELRALASELSSTEDRERRKLALLIHDSVGQMLSVMKLKLTALCRQAERGPLANDLTELLQLIDPLIQQTRSLTFDLYPAMLDDLGLVPTLHWYRTQFADQTGIKVEITEFGQARVLATPVITYVFRAVKELLHNVAKHAHAREVVLSVYWQPQRMRVVVVDDGCGMNMDQATNGTPPSRGLGLVGIRERIASLGGEFVLESWPGRGTQVILEVPLDSP